MTTEAAQDARLRKFQEPLRELFQFDCADLNFGIYTLTEPRVGYWIAEA